jgi:Response regulators consisting of a CheY-like receiver domain and a winged-helix DNA-binding domain
MDTGSGRKILIIEDESDVADLLEMGLRKAGFKTTQPPTAQPVYRRRATTGPMSSFLI